MSREQWGHGYWRGVEDAQAGKVRSRFPEEVRFWIANMCCSNHRKDFDKSLFSVAEWVRYAGFCGMSVNYARRVYDYILNHNFYEFKPSYQSLCYVSGSARSNWVDDYFVIPVSDYDLKEWEQIADSVKESFSQTEVEA